MDYRTELLNKTLLMLDEAGIQELDIIKTILIRAIGEYEITERCTEIAVVDNGNMEIVKLYLAAKRVEGCSKRTAKNTWYIFQKFDEFVNKPFSEVNSFDILCWLADIQKKVKLSTADNYRSVISSLYSWMASNNIIAVNPMEHVKPIKHPNPIKKSFTAVEVDALKSVCKNVKERAIVELLLSSGLRCEELCNLKWQDINFVSKDIHVIEGKGNKNRITMMDDVTRKYLVEYHDKKANLLNEYVFGITYDGVARARTTDSVWRMLKVIGKRAGVKEVNPHKFRHTFATTLYKRGLDLRMIQKLLGHSSINTTMIYIDNDIDMIRDAYKKCV